MDKNKFVEQFYRENYDSLIKYARKRVGDYSLPLAEEAVQEAFYRALKYFKGFDKEAEFSDWFGKILVNVIHDQKRMERVGSTMPPVEGKSEQFHNEIEVSQQVIDLLHRQKPRNLDILKMYFFSDFKSREISEFMSVSHDVVRDVIRTFRKRARNV